MTKRISQANTVVVPVTHADGVDGKVVATKTVVVPAEAEVASAKAEVKADEAPVTVVAEPVAALVAPAPMAMVAEPVAAAEPAAAAAQTTDSDSDDKDYTPYIVGGVLLAGGILAIALSSGDDKTVTPTPTPTPAPTNAVTFSSATTATVAENTAASATVIDVNAAAAATGGAIVYTLGGTDAALFNIDAATGIVTLKTSANFEAKSSYSITVTATSAANGTTPSATATQTITVTVTDVNEAPTFATATASATVAENVPTSTVVYTAAATDPDASTGANGRVTYSLTGTDAAAFTINSTTGVVTFVGSPNFEAKSSYSFNVVATDGGTPALTASQAVTVTVTNVNEAPTFSAASQTVSFAENGTGTVLTATATDPDGTAAPNTLTYTLTGADAALFNVSSTGAVTFKVAPDFEATPTKTTFNFNVVATDQGGLSTTQAETVTLTNVNEAPTFAATTRTTTVAENVPAGTALFTAGGAVDPDAGATVTYSLTGADASAFAVNASTGAVTFVGSPNFEAKASYSFNLVATDQGGLSSSQANTVTITNVNEAPTFAAASQTVSFAENGTGTVLTATATDPDGTAAPNTLTYTLTGTDAALFNVSSTGAVTFKVAPDFEATPTKTTFNFNVVATDQGGLSTTQAETVTLTNVNEAPTFAATTRTTTVAENVPAGTALFTAGGAVDPDAGATVTYSLTGADASAFAVNASTGAVTFVGSPNFEAKASYAFNLVATDQGGLSSSQANTVTITNVNEAPTFAAATRAANLDENVAAGTVVPGSAVATDPDAGATLTYTLTGADAAQFAINPTTGVVTIVASPDFETKSAYNFNVVATDQGGLSATQAVTLNINDLPEGVRIDGAGIAAGSNVNYDASNGNVLYLESGAVGNISTINNFTSGDIIQTDVATSNYSFGSQGSTLVISYNNNGVSTQIFLPNAAGNNFIFNEASAEQAVGFDFFRSSIAAPPASSNTLTGTATYNAANAAVTYTDDATSPNVSTITNFTSDDRIVVTGVNGSTQATTYSFGSNGSDLVISFNNNGVSSQITLVGVANPNVFVFNEATAEQAVGFDFFRYG